MWPQDPTLVLGLPELSHTCSDQQGLSGALGKMNSFPGELECSILVKPLGGGMLVLNLETVASKPHKPSGDFCYSSTLDLAVFPPPTSQHLFPQLDTGGTRTAICLKTLQMLLSEDQSQKTQGQHPCSREPPLVWAGNFYQFWIDKWHWYFQGLGSTQNPTPPRVSRHSFSFSEMASVSGIANDEACCVQEHFLFSPFCTFFI